MWFTPRHVLEQRITLPLEMVRETVVVFSETQENCFTNYICPLLYYRQSGLVQSGVSHGYHACCPIPTEHALDGSGTGFMTGVDYTLRVIFRMCRSPRGFRPH